MNKKVMAIAVAGVFAAPGAALAQASTVTIGGSLTMFYYQHTPHNPGVLSTGVTAGSKTDILETSEPQLSIKVQENLGGGLSAWFQCNSSLDGFVTGAATAFGFCARDSGLGFKGSFGNIFGGNWDTPQKLVVNRARGWWGGTNSLTGGSARILFGEGASGQGNPLQTVAGGFSTTGTTELKTAISNTPSAFYRRHSSQWAYHSPSWSGFQLQAAVSAANQNTGIPEVNPLKARLWSVAGHYDNGPLYLGVAYENHADFNPGNVTPSTAAGTSAYGGGNDSNWTLAAGYKFADRFSLRGLYSQSKYDVSNTTGGLKVKGWGVWADWAIAGPHTLRANYARVGDSSGGSAVNVASYKGPTRADCGVLSASSCATDTGGKVWGIAYSYAFSKRTEGSFVYTKLSNDSNASFSLGKVASTAGNSQTSMGMVLKHAF
jgi:predicted porin